MTTNSQTLAYLSADQVLDKLNSNKRSGLTTQEAVIRLKRDGLNQIEKDTKENFLTQFLKQFTNPLTLILLIVAITSLVLGETIDALIVILMVMLSVVLNSYQEHKANHAVKKLLDKVSLNTTVLREGQKIDIKSTNIVVGDILILNAGDLIPADCRLIDTNDFYINQAAITGESYPVKKTENKIDKKNSDISELDNMIFSGSSVTTGTAKAVVVATGTSTQFGLIAKQLAGREVDNSFTLGIKSFSYFILRIVIVFVVFIFMVNAFLRHDLLESIAFAVAVAIGLAPEFLPIIMTVTMSKGAILMAKRGVIVKKLAAIPAFGSMNILCTDKTGTLTEGQITLVKYVDLEGKHSPNILKMAYVNSFYQAGIANPLDQAVIKYTDINVDQYQKKAEIPFDFIRRRMSVIVKLKKTKLLITKGAPESVLEVSSYVNIKGKTQKINKKVIDLFTKQYNQLSQKGYRVLALATKSLSSTNNSHSKNDENNLVLMGLIAFLDPVKQGVRQVIDRLEKNGIEIKVVTGDNQLATIKACVDAGIQIKGTMLGSQTVNLSDDQLRSKALSTTIFARFSPTQKERIIRVLKSEKNTVGYLGDGINDAPSIKAADVGVSVNNAVDVAKESADFILTNKSLSDLNDAVIQGRTIFGNTMKYVMMGLSSNFGNMFSVLGAVLFLPFLPMLPIQIILNNFIYDISQITIPTDHADPEYLDSPKKWDISFIKQFVFVFGPISSFFDFLTFYVLYSNFNQSPHLFQTGWFIESLTTQILVIHIIRTQRIPFIESISSKALFLSTFLMVILGWLLPYLPLGHIFNLMPLPGYMLIILGLITVAYLLAAEIGKRIFYNYRQGHASL